MFLEPKMSIISVIVVTFLVLVAINIYFAGVFKTTFIHRRHVELSR